jgi:hypothetical protein
MPPKPARDKPASKKRRPKITTKPNKEENELETLYFFQPMSPNTTNNGHTPAIQRFKAVKVGSSQPSKPPALAPWASAPQPDDLLYGFKITDNLFFEALISADRGWGRYNLFNKPNHIPTKEDEEIAADSLLQLANATR